MEMDPNPPQFNLGYTVKPENIGEGYAAGITQAGKSLAEATKGVFDVVQRNRDLDDTLAAMNKSGMLSDEDFQAVAGKSMGAKQTMLGMHAQEWIAQQAQQRSLGQIGYKGTVDAWAEHQKFLDTFNAIRGKYPVGQAPPINLGKAPPPPGQASQPAPGQPGTPPKVQRAQPAPPNLAYTPQGVPTPLGQAGITNPLYPNASATPSQPAQITVGASIGKGRAPNLPMAHVKGQAGYWDADKKIFYPL